MHYSLLLPSRLFTVTASVIPTITVPLHQAPHSVQPEHFTDSYLAAVSLGGRGSTSRRPCVPATVSACHGQSQKMVSEKAEMGTKCKMYITNIFSIPRTDFTKPPHFITASQGGCGHESVCPPSALTPALNLFSSLVCRISLTSA